jgi:hypothetical protein
VTISTSAKDGTLTAVVPSGMYRATVTSLDDLPTLSQAIKTLGYIWDGESDDYPIIEWLGLTGHHPLGALALRIAASEWGA